jgi:hypothetical protein
MTKSDGSEVPIACTLSSEDLVRRRQVIHQLLQKATERLELEDGFEFVFPSSEALLAKVVDFVSFERKCCPFLSFEVVLQLGDGPIHLRLRGREGAKEAIRQIFA